MGDGAIVSWQDRVISRLGGASYTVTRYAEGARTDGLWSKGAPSTVTITALPQPLDGDALKFLPEGRRAEDARLVFTTAPIVCEDGRADVISIGGVPHEVYLVETWTLRGTTGYRVHCARQA